MSSFGRSRRCSHIKVTGHRCGSPALHGEDLCYFHARLIGRVRARIDSVISPVAQLENEEAVQVALMTVINSILKGTIELKRAQLIVRALSIAQRNARHTHFHSSASEMVRHLPEQTAPLASQNKPCHSDPASAGEESAPSHSGANPSDGAVFTPAQQRELDELTRALSGAQHGNLEDFKTILGVAGLFDSDGHL